MMSQRSDTLADFTAASRRAATHLATIAFLNQVGGGFRFHSEAHVREMAVAVVADATKTLLLDLDMELSPATIAQVNREAVQAFQDCWQHLKRRTTRGGQA